MISITCKNCGDTFQTYKAWLRNGRCGSFCSNSCKASSQPRRSFLVVKICRICGSNFSVRRYRSATAVCCSRKCLSVHRGNLISGPNHPFWKGGTSNRSHSTRKVGEMVKNSKGECERCGSIICLHAHHKKGDYPLTPRN